MTPATAAVRAVLLEADYIDDDRSYEFTCDHIAREVAAFGDRTDAAVDRCCVLLDAHRIAVENDPDSRAVAARIVEAVKEAARK